MLENGKPYRHTDTLEFSDPAVDETTGSVTLRTVFPNPEGEILPGMYITVLLDEGSQQDVLMVPQQGITHNEQGKATTLILDQGSMVQLRKINAVKAVGN